MRIQIDARLHLSQPEIFLRSGRNGRILMRWSSHTVQQWLEQGDISSHELMDPNYNWQELLMSTR